ncbi:MAG: transcriptional regulator [Rhodovulum sulfidophilum]|uniref:Transcriptional regulator n=1 Tax=Rhodovulum sulfidophilum TaxID=35806 RepID=A0A2W5PYC7_RHOSU|nr:MAG: transcriptional regulator [Rhodovulum sulfidophilum]
MTDPIHHASDPMLAALAADALPYPFAVLVATHVSLCDACRARLDAHRIVGGLVLDDIAPATLSKAARARVLAGLDAAPSEAAAAGGAPFPAPLAGLVGRDGPPWRGLGFGARQAILWSGGAGSIRLLSIPAGQAVPEHGHRGLELTLVLSGAFADETGAFGAGDLQVADEDLGHTPRATEDGPCLCVAATDAPLRFRALIPRLLQPIFRI